MFMQLNLRAVRKLALDGSEREAWLTAMKCEYDSLTQNEVFSFTEVSDNMNVKGCKWLFKVKQMPDSNVQRNFLLCSMAHWISTWVR